MHKQLLKKALESKSFIKSYPYIGLLGNQLLGTFTVQAEERVELVNLMYAKNHESLRYESSQPTTIHIASMAFALESLGSDLEDPAYFYKEALGYDFYTEKNELAKKNHTSQIEEIKTVFTVLRGEEIAGFYDFDLSFSHEKGQAMLNLNLNQIFVKPEFRGTTYWMDLTIAVYSFVSNVLYCLAEKLSKPHYFDVYVTADFYTKSDEKIAKFIESEIRSMFQTLPELAPHRPGLVGEVIGDMGY